MTKKRAVNNATDIATDGFESVRRNMLKLNPNQMVQGKLVDIVAGKHNQILILKTSEGEFGLYGSTALENIISHDDIGLEFRIKYLGKVKSKKGRKYHDFEVARRGKRVKRGGGRQPSTKKSAAGKKG